MSYDSTRARESVSNGGASGAGGAPGKRSQTDRLAAPAGATSSGSAPTASALSGTAWLDGLLGFTGSHEPTGECNCAGCVAGRVAAQGFNGPEDGPVNQTASKNGGRRDDGGGGPKPTAAPDAGAPAEPGAPGTKPQQAAQKGQQAGPQQAQAGPQQVQAGQQDQPRQEAGRQGTGPTGQGEATPTPPPTITSATRKAAPGGAPNTRTTVGVGEVVDFTGSAAGTWTATAGTPAAGASSNTFAWTAPETPGTVTITLTVGTQSATVDITVIAPSSLSMVVASRHTLTPDVAGVCMVTDVTVGPTTVCFGNTEWLEVPGPASNISGYFTRFSAATLQHNPNPNWLQWNDSNTGLTDHAAAHALPPRYSEGAFEWSIPNMYRVAGGGGAGAVFTTTTQVFQMTDTAGSMSVSKAGASVSRPQSPSGYQIEP